MYDIYNPPPAPIPHTPPKPAPIAPRMGDLIILGFLVLGLTTISLIAWSFEPTLSVLIGLGGGLVIGESWFTGVAFLQRHPVAGRKLLDYVLGRACALAVRTWRRRFAHACTVSDLRLAPLASP